MNFLIRTVLVVFCCLLNLHFLTASEPVGEPLFARNPDIVMGEVVYYSAFPKLPIDSGASFDAEALAAQSGNIDSMMKCATMCVYTDDPLTVNLSMALIYYRMAACKGDEENVQGALRKQCAAAALTCAIMLFKGAYFGQGNDSLTYFRLSEKLGHPIAKKYCDLIQQNQQAQHNLRQCNQLFVKNRNDAFYKIAVLTALVWFLPKAYVFFF